MISIRLKVGSEYRGRAKIQKQHRDSSYMTGIWLNVEDEEGVQEASQVSSSGHSEGDDAINRKKKKRQNIALNTLSLRSWCDAHVINFQQMLKTDLSPPHWSDS